MSARNGSSSSSAARSGHTEAGHPSFSTSLFGAHLTSPSSSSDGHPSMAFLLSSGSSPDCRPFLRAPGQPSRPPGAILSSSSLSAQHPSSSYPSAGPSRVLGVVDTSNSYFDLGFSAGTSPSSRSSSPLFVRPQGRAPPRRPSPTPPVQSPVYRTPRPSPFPPPSTTPRSGSRGGICGTASNLPTPSGTIRSRSHNDNVIVALAHGRGFARNEVGLAAMNLTACELHLTQISDTLGYVKTLAKMNLFRPTEVLMPDTVLMSATDAGPSSSSSLVQCIQRFDGDVAITGASRSAFSEAGGIQCIQKLAVADHLSILHVVEQKYYALAAANALVAHLEDNLSISFAPNTLRVYYRGTEETVIIDSETSHRLELVSSLNPMGGPSLLSALNHCQTASGSRLLRSNILEPWTNWQAIHQRLEAVEELASRPTDLHQPIKEILSRFVDVERAVNQCIVVPKNPNLSFVETRLNAVVALKHILTLVPPLRYALSKARSSLVSTLAQELSSPKYEELLGRIQRVVDDRTKVVKGKIGMQRQRFSAIKTGINLMLDVCRQTHVDLEVEIEEYVEELSAKYQMPLILANTPARGYHLQRPIRRIKGDPPPDIRLPPVFICVKKQGNSMAFTTQHLLVVNERIKSVQKDVEKITNVVVEDLLAEIRGEIGFLYKLRELVCQLDVVVSFAQVALGGGYCRPTFGTGMMIRNGRHPILDRFSPVDLASNDTEMSAECNFLVITGANMSGKSTYIRQVMLLQVMAQIGCFVPASSASFRIVDRLFSRLGTNDRLENNASSFTLEMMEMNYVVRNAGPNSLVILDELCKETSVDQGAAICWSMCEALLSARAWVLIATHNTLITKLEDLYYPVANYHMEVVEEEREDGRPALTYTHRLLPGVTQVENYGMKLARLAALPDEVLDKAAELIPVLSAAVKPQPRVTFDFKMEKLQYKLHLRLLDVGRRLSALPDEAFLEELARVRRSYKEELSEIFSEDVQQ